MTRYILHPGKVRSSTDGQTHYLSAISLQLLYGIDLSTPVTFFTPTGEAPAGFVSEPGDVHLYPRSDGDYRLPDAEPPPKPKTVAAIDFSKRKVRIRRE